MNEGARARLALSAKSAFRFEVAERTIEVIFDDARARDAFASRFARHATRRKPEFYYYVARDGTARYFFSSRSQAWRWVDGPTAPQTTAFLADAAVISAIVRSDAQLLSLHAAVVAHEGRIAAIGGTTWAGKSTTAVACVRAGMQFYSDERLLVRGTTVYPFQRLCTLRPASRKLLAADRIGDALEKRLLRDAEPEHDWRNVSIAKIFGARRIGRPGPLTAIFVLSGRSTNAAVRPILHQQAVPALFPWMDSREGDFKRLAQLVELIAAVPCFALELGSPKASAAAIARTLERVASNVA